MVQECFGGKAAGGSFEVDDLSSACRATKSLYRLLTVQVRMGVETGHFSSSLTLHLLDIRMTHEIRQSSRTSWTHFGWYRPYGAWAVSRPA